MNFDWLNQSGLLKGFLNLATEFAAFENLIILFFAISGAFSALFALWSLVTKSARNDPNLRMRAIRRFIVGTALGSLVLFVEWGQQSAWGAAPEHAHTYTSQMAAEPDPIKQTMLALCGFLVLMGWFFSGKAMTKIRDLSDNPDHRRDEIKQASWMFFGSMMLIGLSSLGGVAFKSLGFDTGGF